MPPPSVRRNAPRSGEIPYPLGWIFVVGEVTGSGCWQRADSVGVPEPAERLGLPLKARHGGRSEGRARLQQLEGEDLLEPQVSGAIDDADGPFAEAGVQAVFSVEDAGGL